MNNDELTEAREELGLIPSQMAESMGVSYDTYKDWQSGRRKMSASAIRCVEMLVAMKGTRIGKKFGV